MPLPDRKKMGKTKRLAFDAVFISCAMLFSYLETLLPISLLIPLPGIGLGFANLVVMLAFFITSPIDAAVISFIRISLSALLFGTPVSFCFSLFGGLLSFAGLFLMSFIARKGHISFIGLSAVSAVFHSFGQIISAMIIYTPAAASYLPILILCSTLTGTLTGVIANLIYKRTEKIIYEKS